MNDLHLRQCLNHPGREAVARCPECRHFYCRECIAEHEDRIICAACLRKMFRSSSQHRHPLRSRLARGTAFGLSLCIGWLAFYLAGKILLSIPASVHDSTIWQTGFFQE